MFCSVTTEYPAAIALHLTAYLFLKNDECAQIDYLELRGILLLSYGFYFIALFLFFFFQAEDGIRDIGVTGVQTCALPI